MRRICITHDTVHFKMLSGTVFSVHGGQSIYLGCATPYPGQSNSSAVWIWTVIAMMHTTSQIKTTLSIPKRAA